MGAGLDGAATPARVHTGAARAQPRAIRRRLAAAPGHRRHRPHPPRHRPLPPLNWVPPNPARLRPRPWSHSHPRPRPPAVASLLGGAADPQGGGVAVAAGSWGLTHARARRRRPREPYEPGSYRPPERFAGGAFEVHRPASTLPLRPCAAFAYTTGLPDQEWEQARQRRANARELLRWDVERPDKDEWSREQARRKDALEAAYGQEGPASRRDPP